MKWGLTVALLSVLGLGLAGGGGVAEGSGPVYETAPGPVYEIPPPRKARFHFAGLRLNRHSGTAIVFVRVPGAGRAILHGRGIRRRVRVAGRARRLWLPVGPKVRLMHYLRRRRKGRIRVAATFRPDDGGAPQTIEKVVVLRRHRRS